MTQKSAKQFVCRTELMQTHPAYKSVCPFHLFIRIAPGEKVHI
ncbi:hypothetical protein EFW58_04152 [Bacillus velezensis]|nr:hypothetical protein EFW58_04152 [Bacillus velezensis]